MLIAFTWNDNFHFAVNNGGISKNDFFIENLIKILVDYYFLGNGKFLA